jgi:hypothetical protein
MVDGQPDQLHDDRPVSCPSRNVITHSVTSLFEKIDIRLLTRAVLSDAPLALVGCAKPDGWPLPMVAALVGFSRRRPLSESESAPLTVALTGGSGLCSVEPIPSRPC